MWNIFKTFLGISECSSIDQVFVVEFDNSMVEKWKQI